MMSLHLGASGEINSRQAALFDGYREFVEEVVR
jgi:hypothetical protein